MCFTTLTREVEAAAVYRVLISSLPRERQEQRCRSPTVMRNPNCLWTARGWDRLKAIHVGVGLISGLKVGRQTFHSWNILS
mmetsp:Transcript_7135/g.14002  ORF Transcript_7135/g.14002 Transcript_7135/m.14002 type:complete len:81 (+) Transcript_7135:302-544(+)